MIARGTSSLPRPSGFQQGIHDFVSLYHQTHQMSKRGEGHHTRTNRNSNLVRYVCIREIDGWPADIERISLEMFKTYSLAALTQHSTYHPDASASNS